MAFRVYTLCYPCWFSQEARPRYVRPCSLNNRSWDGSSLPPHTHIHAPRLLQTQSRLCNHVRDYQTVQRRMYSLLGVMYNMNTPCVCNHVCVWRGVRAGGCKVVCAYVMLYVQCAS